MGHYGDAMLSLKAFLKEIITNAQTIALSDFRVEKIISKHNAAYKIWASEKVSPTTALKEINQEILPSLLIISKIKMTAVLRLKTLATRDCSKGKEANVKNISHGSNICLCIHLVMIWINKK